jgi:hypothetical protein
MIIKTNLASTDSHGLLPHIFHERILSGYLIKLKQIAQVVADCSRVHEAKMFVARRTFNNALELFCSCTSACSAKSE